MEKFFLKIWRLMPSWLQSFASRVIRPHYLVAVGAIIFDEDNQLLLCKHSYRRIHPWGLPGGDLKPGEDPEKGIRRELFEETGLEVKSANLLLVRNSERIRHLDLTFLCQGISGTFKSNYEVESIAYFALDELPELQSEEKITITQALKMLAGARAG
jgi:8-oxo-dGTP diphosphatase